MKSKSESLVAGCRRFAIELYNTNTVHDVIITHEMLAAGHAQSSPEGIKVSVMFIRNLRAIRKKKEQKLEVNYILKIQLFRERLSEKKHQSARDKTERWYGYSLEFCILA